MLLKITTKKNEVLYVRDDDFDDYSYLSNTTSSSEFELGGAIPCSFDCTIFDHDFKQYILYGATIEAYLGDVEDEDKLLGTFTINKTDIDQDIIVINSDDDLAKTDVKWKGRSFPCTMWELLTNVCEQVDIELGVIQEDLINANIILTTESGLVGRKCRDILKWIAEANGMYCIMSRRNNLLFKIYDFKNIKTIRQEDMDSLKLEQTNTTRKGTIINHNNKNIKFGDTSYSLKLTDNPILSNLSSSELTKAGNALNVNIQYIDYYAGTFNVWENDYDLQVGDVVKVVDDDGQEFIVAIHDMTMDNEGEFYSIVSYGDSIESKNEILQEDDYEDTNTNDTTNLDEEKTSRALNHQIIRAKQGRYTLLEKVVYDINYYTRVLLLLSINFYYTNGKKIIFEIYANEKKIREVPVVGTDGIYHVVEAFMADVDYDSETCVYSVRVSIEEGNELLIDKFKGILTLHVSNGMTSDAIATDQYFIERVKAMSYGTLNQYKVKMAQVYDELDIPSEEPIALMTWDVSAANDNSMPATLYSNGALDIQLAPFDETIMDSSQYGTMKEMASIQGNYGQNANTWREYGTTWYEQITTVTIGSGIKNIGDYALAELPNLVSSTAQSIEEVGTRAYYQSPINSFNAGSGLKVIKNGAFENANLKSINLANVEAIWSSAFVNTKLTSVYLPDTLTLLGAETFYGCEELISVYNFPSNVNVNGGPDCGYEYLPNTIPTACFRGCTNLETLELQEGLVGIDGIVNCASLNPIFPSTITYVGLLNGCGIEDLDLSNCTYFGGAVGCENLLNVVLGDNLTSIGGFKNCTKLQTISGFPIGITEIPKYWLQNCSGVERLDLPESVNRIGQYAFKNCSSLTSIGLANISTLGKASFYGCSSLGFVNISSSTFSIPDFCFQNCSSLQGITLSSSIEHIGLYAFMNCTSLDLVINANQEDIDIDAQAFDGIKSVTWV